MPKGTMEPITEELAKKFIKSVLIRTKGKDANDFPRGLTSLFASIVDKFPKSFQSKTRCYAIIRHITDRPDLYDPDREKMLSELERIKARKAIRTASQIEELEKRIISLEKEMEKLKKAS